MESRIKQLETMVAELMAWKNQKIRQQISLPLDNASRNVLGQPEVTGTGTFGTQEAVADLETGAVTVPAQPSGTVLIKIEGVTYELLKK